MEELSLSSKSVITQKDYMDTFTSNGELDKRMFVNKDDSLLGTSSLPGSAINIRGFKRKIGTIASTKDTTSALSPPCSPPSHVSSRFVGAISKTTPTAVRTAMTTTKWLQTVISPLPSKPSAELEQFLSSCDRNVTDEAISRANIILGAIFPSGDIGKPCITGGLLHDNPMDSLWAGQRQIEALKLYYKVLESICTAEAQKLCTGNLTLLLTNDGFHRCMLACSAELVSERYKTTSFPFSVVWKRIGITAFDMSKVIESFIIHEESLPRELRRYLNSLEELLLESMIWEKGSSLYNYLVVARPALAAEINHLRLLAEPMLSLDAIAMYSHVSCGGLPQQSFSQKQKSFLGMDGSVRSLKRERSEYCNMLDDHKSFASPMKDCPPEFNNVKSKLPSPSPPLQSAFSSPRQPNSQCGRNTCTEKGISVLFNKMAKLAAVRINSIADRLELSQQIRENIHCLFQKILFQQTPLFFNRHIDQIILCSFYGVTKHSELNLSFKEIVNNYKRQPQCRSQVLDYVFVNWSSAHGNGENGEAYVSIIRFYNEIFVLVAKPLLDEIGSARASNRVPEVNNNDHCPGSPQMPPFQSIPNMSPKKISPSHNVYLSPLRPSKKDALISHGGKSYYARVGKSTEDYQSPTKDLNVINNCLNGSRKPRGMLNFDDVDVHLVSDSLVVSSLFLKNTNCAS